ncbi:MAG TPA: hypothetical protein VM580_30825, partial [Labilithrix sp.]|nr:hypothetical protein [Labilithrix sp.]
MSKSPPMTYLRNTLVPWPNPTSKGRLALSDPKMQRIAVYDSALMVLVLIRRGTREEAAQVVEGLYAVQKPDGSLPFSFVLPAPDDQIPYVRAGAVAWVGYAATEFLDAERGGPSRDHALALARNAAKYLLAHQLNQPGDPRDGLVRGGEGSYRYELDARGQIQERLFAEDVMWTAMEHNVDSYFFFRALARVTEDARYAEAATRIARGLARAWNGARGQLARGATAEGHDNVLTLD